MGFQHAKQEDHKLAGMKAAAQSAKTPDHLRSHLSHLAAGWKIVSEDVPRGNLTAHKSVSNNKDSEPKYKYRSTQVNLPKESDAYKALEATREQISDEDLAGDGKDIGGNHLTVRYGLKDGSDIESVRRYLSSLEPFEAKLGKTSKFDPTEHSDGAAVVHAPVESARLHEINSELAKHGDFKESDFPDFKPHVTLAYVRPEAADKYVGMAGTHGKSFKVKSISITARNGGQEEVPLAGNSGTKESAGVQGRSGENLARPQADSSATGAQVGHSQAGALDWKIVSEGPQSYASWVASGRKGLGPMARKS
jgi:hypothetical protein